MSVSNLDHLIGIFNLTKVESLCADPRLDHPYFGTERSANAAQTVQALINWCHACRYNDGSVNPKGWFSEAQANEQAMSMFDWVALIFCSAIVGLALAGEYFSTATGLFARA